MDAGLGVCTQICLEGGMAEGVQMWPLIQEKPLV